MKRPCLAATVVAALCIVSAPAVALVSRAERASILERHDQPRWPDTSRAIRPLNWGVPTMALLPTRLLLPQALLDRPPVEDSATRTPMAINASSRMSASLRRIPPHKVMFASLKGRPQALFRPPHEVVFIGGLY
jgi:hypothetical protein